MDRMTDRKNIANEQYFSTDHLQTGLRTRAIKGASITMLAQAVSFGIQTFGSIILARMLSPRDFGLVAMVLAFSLLLQSFGCNGFIEAVVQRAEVHHKQISTLFWINFAISLCLALLFFMAGPLMAGFYKEPRLQPIVSVMALSIFFGGLANQHVSILTRTMQFYKTTSNELFSSFVSTGVAIFFAWRGWGILGPCDKMGNGSAYDGYRCVDDVPMASGFADTGHGSETIVALCFSYLWQFCDELLSKESG